jgi:hypothetical protein
MFVALGLAAGGCGGISASKTISPLDFLLPGIIKNNPTPTTNTPVAWSNNSNVLASAR